ncbi:MAG: P-II family nitrogen regulator [Bradymonadales bacterium]
MIALQALFVIVNEGKASKISDYARSIGAPGATIVRGQGSLPNRILCFFGLERMQKEILLLVLSDDQHKYVFDKICTKFCFEKNRRGIAFTVPVDYHLAVKRLPTQEKPMQSKDLNQGPHLIVTIVDRGNAQNVIESANAAGAKGATILHARGSGIEESEAFFDIKIQPEKDVILIVAPSSLVMNICNNISEKANLHENGRGILFTLPIKDAAGVVALQNQ